MGGSRVTRAPGPGSEDGKIRSEDNPVILANRKAKALSSLLKAQSAVAKVKVPWLDALVFLSADDVQCDLTGPPATGSASRTARLRENARTQGHPRRPPEPGLSGRRSRPPPRSTARSPRRCPVRWSRRVFVRRSGHAGWATTSSAT